MMDIFRNHFNHPMNELMDLYRKQKQFIGTSLECVDKVVIAVLELLEGMEKATDPRLGRGVLSEDGIVVNEQRDPLLLKVSQGRLKVDDILDDLDKAIKGLLQAENKFSMAQPGEYISKRSLEERKSKLEKVCIHINANPR